MKNYIIIALIAPLAFAGRFGVGFSGGTEYDRDYQAMSYEQLPVMFYGGEFHLQAEALPALFLEPTVSYLNNPQLATSAVGAGLRLTVQPRLGRFPLAPFFGVEGTLMFYNQNLDLQSAIQSGRLEEYLRTSNPRPIGYGFAGMSIYLGRSLSLDGQYRYLRLSEQYAVQMVWAGLTFYLNW
jgi:hypothetical protein